MNENMFWLTFPPNKLGVLDTQVILLENPEHYQRLDPTIARQVQIHQSAFEILGSECDYVHRTFYQDPRNIPTGRNMYPFYYELLGQLPRGVSFKAFQLIDVPALIISVKEIYSDFIFQDKKIPFEVRLWT